MKATKTARPRAKKMAAIDTDEVLRASVDEIAEMEVKLRGLVAARDFAMQEVQRLHDGEIEDLKKTIKQQTKLCAVYSASARKSLFGVLKSAASKLASFGFRKGNPTLKVLNSNWNWDKVMAKAKELGRTDLIRVAEELDKDAIKSANMSESQLAAMGLRIDQGETFYVEPKSPDAERYTADSNDHDDA